MRPAVHAAWPLLVLAWLGLTSCRPTLEGASCREDRDCPRSQYCSGQKCREGRRVNRPDAGGATEDGGSSPGEDAGTPCDASAGCTVTVSASPPDARVGTPVALTCTVRDGAGTPLPDVTVALEVSGLDNTLDAAGGRTDEAGTFVGTLGSTRAESKRIVVTAGTALAELDLVFGPGAPDRDKSTVNAKPGAPLVGSAATLELVIRDGWDNPVPGLELAVTATGTANTLGAPTVTADETGTARTTLSSTRAEPKQVTFSAGDFSLTLPVAFSPGAPAASRSSLVAQPASVDAGEPTTLVLTVLDAYDNPVPGLGATFGGGVTGDQFGDATGQVTSGAGTLSTGFVSTVAGIRALDAQVAGGTRVGGTVTVTPLAPDATTTTLEASPASVRAREQATLTLRARDVHGNPVPGQGVSLAVSGTQNTTSALGGTTGGDGTFTLMLQSTRAEVKQVSATVGGVTKSVPVEVRAGAPAAATSSFTHAAAAVAAGGSTGLTVTVRDADGNPVAGAAVALSCSGTGNTLTPASGTTNGQGVFTAALSSTRAEAKSLSAEVSTLEGTSLSLGAAVTFTLGPPAQDTSSLSLGSGSVPVSSGSGGTVVTVGVKDAYGNPVSGVPVSLAATGSSNVFSAPSGTTNAAGQYTSALTSTRAESKTVTATFGGLQTSAGVIFTPGPVLDATSSLAVNPSALAAGESAAVTATLRDAFGNPVAGRTVTLSSLGSDNAFGQASGSSDAAGVFSTTFTSTRAESKQLSAAVDGLTLGAALTVGPAAPSSAASSVTASPAAPVAGQSTQVTVAVRDAWGNPVTGQAVSLSVSGSANALGATSGSTAAGGTWSTPLSSTRAEAKQVTATFGAASAGMTVQFLPGAPSATQSSLGVTPPSGLPGTGARTAEVTVRDGLGNPVPGLDVTLTATGGAVATSPTQPTDAQGKAV
ncbi:MAG: Ig-like domain-containing protein, partial [Deltaproteobacteria bacterium]|nr:Ig-like domain-containing protein [Deltaproteobacteria bacterium]